MAPRLVRLSELNLTEAQVKRLFSFRPKTMIARLLWDDLGHIAGVVDLSHLPEARR